jgi:two-component system sensor histidine kinase/response regulator
VPLRRKTLFVLAAVVLSFLGVAYISSRLLLLSRLAAGETNAIRLYAGAAAILFGVAFGGIVQLLLEKSVISRLSVLNSAIASIAGGIDDNSRHVQAGRDELATLGNAVRRMIDAFQQSEKQRNEIEARHRIFMNNLPAIAAIKDIDGKYLYFNDPMAKVFQLSQASFDKPLEPTWLPAETRELIRSHELEVLRLGRGLEFEEMVPTPDGVERYWLTLRFPLTGADGTRLIGMCAIDITARKRAETELQLARDAADLASRTKAEFLANMSHEIRTPINAVIGMTDLALESGLTSEQRDCLLIVKSSARTLLSVFNDVIDFLKMEAGTLDFESIDFNVRGVLDSIVRSLATAAREKNIELLSRVDSAVPDAVRGDPTRFRQILANLIQVVLKDTPSGPIVVSAEPEMVTEDEAVLHFSVQTPVEGISLPSLPSRPGVAYRIETEMPQVDVAGLGMAIAGQLVELIGGRIWVESDPGHGSSLNFNARFDLSSQFAEAGRPAPMSQLRGLRVMVVDDNPSNRRILADMLSSWGMRPTVAAGGDEAIEELRHAFDQGVPFALAILDGRMPGMDGFTLADKIRSNPEYPRVGVILLASAGLRGDAARCRDLGIKAYLPKPVSSADLLDAIRRMVGQSSADSRRPDTLLTRHSLREARHHLKILIAEDNAVDRTLAVRLLEKRGYTVETVETGKAALDALERQPFDAVLMDIQMPEMDGLEATTAIRAHERFTGQHVPIIAMTAYAMSGDKERCLAAGMDRYIAKPLNVQHLYQTIDELSDSRIAPSIA